MPQLSLYLDEPTMEMLKERSRRSRLSLSKYAAKLIQNEGSSQGWPRGYWERVYGSLKDPTFVVPDEVAVPLDDIQLFDDERI